MGAAGGGVSGCDTISGGPMGVESRGGFSFSFQRQDKQGNESVIISRNCLPLCLSSPGLSPRLRSLVGNGLIKECHCLKRETQEENLQVTAVTLSDTSGMVCVFTAALLPLLHVRFHVASVCSPKHVTPDQSHRKEEHG